MAIGFGIGLFVGATGLLMLQALAHAGRDVTPEEYELTLREWNQRVDDERELTSEWIES